MTYPLPKQILLLESLCFLWARGLNVPWPPVPYEATMNPRRKGKTIYPR